MFLQSEREGTHGRRKRNILRVELGASVQHLKATHTHFIFIQQTIEVLPRAKISDGLQEDGQTISTRSTGGLRFQEHVQIYSKTLTHTRHLDGMASQLWDVSPCPLRPKRRKPRSTHLWSLNQNVLLHDQINVFLNTFTICNHCLLNVYRRSLRCQIFIGSECLGAIVAHMSLKKLKPM